MPTVTVRELTSPADLDAAFVLRHRVCAEELGWVSPSPDGRETDVWDGAALHVGAFAGPELIGYVRVVADSPERDIMTRHCFADLFAEPDPRPPVAVTADLSRLVVAPGYRAPGLMYRLSVAMLDLAHGRSVAMGLGFWYLVTGAGRIEMIRGLFAGVRVLGCGSTSDGDENCVALVDLHTRFVAGARRAG